MSNTRKIVKWIKDRICEDTWECECGYLHTFLEGTPKQNEFSYCPYCGGKINQIEEETKP